MPHHDFAGLGAKAASPALTTEAGFFIFAAHCGNNSVVECQLPKLKAASSNLVSRSSKIKRLQRWRLEPLFSSQRTSRHVARKNLALSFQTGKRGHGPAEIA